MSDVDLFEASPAPMGHNMPPGAIDAAMTFLIAGAALRFYAPAAAVSQLLRDRLNEFEVRKAEFLANAAQVVIRDREDVAKATDLVGMARDVGTIVDEASQRIARPHRDAATRVRELAAAFWAPVTAEMQRVTRMIDDWKRAERGRQEAQQAEQQEVERRARQAQQAVAAPAPIPPPAPPLVTPAKARDVRGDYGYKAASTEDDVITIDDVRALPDMVLNAEPVLEAIRKVLKPMVRNKMVVPGISVTRNERTSVRR